MNYIASNVVAILVATIAGMAIGAAYSSLTGRRLQDRSPGSGRHLAVLLLAVCLAEFWLAAILAGALILAPSTEAGAWTMAIGSAVVIWIGFVVPVLVVSYLFRQVGASILLLDCVHWGAVMITQAAILHSIGLGRP